MGYSQTCSDQELAHGAKGESGSQDYETYGSRKKSNGPAIDEQFKSRAPTREMAVNKQQIVAPLLSQSFCQ